MKQADLHLGFQVDKAATAPEQPPGEPESCISLLSNGTDLTSSNAIVLKMRGIDSEICCPARSIYTAVRNYSKGAKVSEVRFSVSGTLQAINHIQYKIFPSSKSKRISLSKLGNSCVFVFVIIFTLPILAA